MRTIEIPESEEVSLQFNYGDGLSEEQYRTNLETLVALFPFVPAPREAAVVGHRPRLFASKPSGPAVVPNASKMPRPMPRAAPTVESVADSTTNWAMMSRRLAPSA